MIFLHAETRESRHEKESRGESWQEDSRHGAESRGLGRKLFIMHDSIRGSKRSLTVSAEAKYDGQFRQEAKTGGLVYALWFMYLVEQPWAK